MLVPEASITQKTPPMEPVFFNPRAKINRDFSTVAYAAFLRGFDGPRVFLEGQSGLGARGLRAANESGGFEKIILNDLNPHALELAGESAGINGLTDVEFSCDETCRFFGGRSKKGRRGAIVDIDPFGSPARFLDCCARATMHGGMLSVTATDLQVLNGLFQGACLRRYGGTPIRSEFGNEIAIRLILGCLRHITARLDMEIQPLFVQSDQHYYRIYARMLNRPDQAANIGYIYECKACGGRGALADRGLPCEACGQSREFAGPLWTGRLFEKEFLEAMGDAAANLTVDKMCEKGISKSILESGMPASYHTLDEIASKAGRPPPRLDDALGRLQDAGFSASPTSLNPTGFRTDAGIDEVKRIVF